MVIHALSTGSVRLTKAFLHPEPGPLRQAKLFLRSPWSQPMPIHSWLLEHEGQRVLVDTGETAAVRDVPFARFSVAPSDELPAALATVGLTPADVDTAVLTHMHGDHMDGAVHLDGPVLVCEAELAFTRSVGARMTARLLRQPVPDVDFRPVPLDDGPFGAFAAHRRLTEDGRVLMVATPGHTPGHVSVLAIDDDGRHVLLAGDSADSLEQLLDRRPDAVAPDPQVHVGTLDRILAHGREHPTVFLPSHDPESAARLAAGATL